MASSPGCLRIYCVHSILWWQNIVISTIFPEVSSWAPFSCGYYRQWTQKDIDCWFGSGSIGFLTISSQKFD